MVQSYSGIPPKTKRLIIFKKQSSTSFFFEKNKFRRLRGFYGSLGLSSEEEELVLREARLVSFKHSAPFITSLFISHLLFFTCFLFYLFPSPFAQHGSLSLSDQLYHLGDKLQEDYITTYTLFSLSLPTFLSIPH